MASGMSSRLRAAVALLVALSALLLTAPPASAHARVKSSDPAEGATLDVGPDRVSITFTEELPADYSTIEVLGPDDRAYDEGGPSVNGTELSTDLSVLGPAGVYRIVWTVVSEDGHPVEGDIEFTLSTPGGGSGRELTEDEPSASEGDSGTWLWISAGVVGVGLAAAVGLVLSRRLGR